MKAGFAKLDITPEVGANIPGQFSPQRSTGVHDPLYVRAAVFESAQGLRAAIVGIDALSAPRGMVLQARSRAEELSGVPAGSIMIAASHTHQGGPIASALGSEADPAYVRFVSDSVAEAVRKAVDSLVPARLACGEGCAQGVSFNRRFRMKDGSIVTHPGKYNPDVICPAGPVDPAVGVLAAWEDESSRVAGCIVNFACHGTTLGGYEFSADWICYLDEVIRLEYGEDCVVIFTPGACGDITQVDNMADREPEFGDKWARVVGETVGREAIRAISSSVPKETERLAVRSEMIVLSRRLVTEEDIAAAQALLSSPGVWDRERYYAREIVLLAEEQEREPVVEAEVQAMGIGDMSLVSIPAEYFCSFGLRIKEQSPHPHTYVVTMANGCVGYVPTPEAFGWGYEPRLARSSKLTPDSGDLLADAALRVLELLPQAD